MSTIKHKGLLVAETPKALLVKFFDLPDDSPTWIPRSHIDNLFRDYDTTKTKKGKVELTLPNWKAQQLGLDY